MTDVELESLSVGELQTKQDEVHAQLIALMQERPRTPEVKAALKAAEETYDAITAELDRLAESTTLEEAIGLPPSEPWPLSADELAQVETTDWGLIDDYVAWARKRTSAPTEYHEATILAVLSTLTQRRLVMCFSHKALYPNLWFCLLGLSGLYKKSTAMSYGSDLLDIVAEDLRLVNDFSIEALISELEDKPVGLFIRDELSSLLANLKRDYMRGGKDFLNWVHDCPDRYRRRLQNTQFELKNIYVVALAATTPKRLLALVDPEDWYTGFLARWCFVMPSEPPEYRDAVYETPDIRTERDALAAKLVEIRKTFNDGIVEARFTPEALVRYNAYCRGLQAELQGEVWAEELSATYARLEEVIAKVAMLVETAKTRPVGNELQVSNETLLSAINWTEQIRQNARQLCAEFQGEERVGDKERVLRLIERRPGILWRRLLMNSHIGAGALRVILEELEHEGRIRSEPEGKTTCYYATL